MGGKMISMLLRSLHKSSASEDKKWSGECKVSRAKEKALKYIFFMSVVPLGDYFMKK